MLFSRWRLNMMKQIILLVVGIILATDAGKVSLITHEIWNMKWKKNMYIVVMHRPLALPKRPEPTILAYHWGNYRTETDPNRPKLTLNWKLILHDKKFYYRFDIQSSSIMILIGSMHEIIHIDQMSIMHFEDTFL